MVGHGHDPGDEPTSARRTFLRGSLGTAVAACSLAQRSESGAAGRTAPAPVGSTLSPDAIAGHVGTEYYVEVRRCELWHLGINHTYRLQTPDGIKWFRLSRHDRHPAGFVAGEIDMMRHLHAQGIPVARPIADRRNAFVRPVDAPEGPRDGVLFHDAGSGRSPGLHKEIGHALGRGLAALHTAANRHPEVPRPRLDLDALLLEPVDAAAPYLREQPATLELLKLLARELHAYLGELVAPRPRWGFCHGDLHFGNVFFDARHRPTFIDFDHAINSHLPYDLAGHLWFIGPAQFFDAIGRSVRKRYWQAFFAGYGEDDPVFRRTVEAFVPVHPFEFLRFATGHPHYFGVSGLQPRRIAGMLNFCLLWGRELKLPLDCIRHAQAQLADAPAPTPRWYPARPGRIAEVPPIG